MLGVAGSGAVAAVATPTVVLGLGGWMLFATAVGNFILKAEALIRCLELSDKPGPAEILGREVARLRQELAELEQRVTVSGQPVTQ